MEIRDRKVESHLVSDLMLWLVGLFYSKTTSQFYTNLYLHVGEVPVFELEMLRTDVTEDEAYL